MGLYPIQTFIIGLPKPLCIDPEPRPGVPPQLVRILDNAITDRQGFLPGVVSLDDVEDLLTLLRIISHLLEELLGDGNAFQLMHPIDLRRVGPGAEGLAVKVFGNSLPTHVMKDHRRNDHILFPALPLQQPAGKPHGDPRVDVVLTCIQVGFCQFP
jgi:hypothetical protein